MVDLETDGLNREGKAVSQGQPGTEEAFAACPTSETHTARELQLG